MTMALFRFKRNDDGNPLDLSNDDLKRRFGKWIKTRDKLWLETQKSDYIVDTFIGAYDGLDSTITDEQKYKVVLLLKPMVYDAKYS